MKKIPVFRLSGGARGRGRSHGEQARTQLACALDVYRAVFKHYADLSWAQACRRALVFEPALKEYDPAMLEEIHGIAEGADLPPAEIMALNYRTDLMFARGVSAIRAGECTSVAVLPRATRGGKTFSAQNWDWHPDLEDALCLFTIEQAAAPRLVMFTEAGQLGKMGLNSAGVSINVNLLLTDREPRPEGVCMHAVIRGAQNAANAAEAVYAIARAKRSTSLNYLIAHVEGEALDVEAATDDWDYLHPRDGILTHANHFRSPRLAPRDVGKDFFPDTIFRDARLDKLLRERHGDITLGDIKRGLQDHFNAPVAICRHLNPAKKRVEQVISVASVIIDLTENTLHVSCGNPCENEYVAYDFREFLEGSASATENQAAG